MEMLEEMDLKKCQFYGLEIKTTFHHGCKMKIVGKYGRRKFCCKVRKTCIEKHCTFQKKRCSYSGPLHEFKIITHCSWSQYKRYSKRKNCCKYLRRCIKYSKTHKKCENQKLDCHFVGKIIESTNKEECHWKNYGKNGKRKKMLFLEKCLF